jgi:signal transduction histidine kinase/CheY-like chemotaxis protein
MISCSDQVAQIYEMDVDEAMAFFSSWESELSEIHPEDQARYTQNVNDSEAQGEGRSLQYRIITKSGAIRHVQLRSELVFDDQGNLVSSYGTEQDITELKEAEEKLRHAQRMEAVGQLTGGLAHDFNNLLAIIQGNVELFARENDKSDLRLQAIVRASKRGAELTHRMLAFSRTQILKPRTIDLNESVSGLVDMLGRTVEKHIDINFVRGTGLWTCDADPGELENVILNIALNARDAMLTGGKLTIETENARLDDEFAATQADLSPGEYVLLVISDTGVGMSPDVSEHVFEPFFTTKAVGEGSGLGLSMVYGFVKQSGGHISIYSEQGVGTTVKLYLPRSTGGKVHESGPVTEETPLAQGETVLVAEDDPDFRALVIALLDSLGYQIMEADTGAAALELLASGKHADLLLTDLILPGGMTGHELAMETKNLNPEIGVLYMSGYTENTIVHHGRLDAGANLLEKPFNRTDLAKALRSVLRKPRVPR